MAVPSAGFAGGRRRGGPFFRIGQKLTDALRDFLRKFRIVSIALDFPGQFASGG